MTRQLVTPEQLTTLSPVPSTDPTTMKETGSWLVHERIAAGVVANFPSEVVRRRNGQYLSSKAVPIFVSEGDAARVGKRGLVSRSSFFRQLKSFYAKLYLNHVKRPVYYYPFADDDSPTGLKENWQLELPGGQVKGKEGAAQALTELLQEAKIGASQVLCWAPAYFSPSANDAGTHVERYDMWYVLCAGEAKTPVGKEGIVGSQLIPLDELERLIHSAQQLGTPIDIFVHTAVLGLMAGMCGAYQRF